MPDDDHRRVSSFAGLSTVPGDAGTRWSFDPRCGGPRIVARLLSLVAEVAEQAQDLEVEPDERHDEPERDPPGLALLDAGGDEALGRVEVQDEAEGGNADADDCAKEAGIIRLQKAAAAVCTKRRRDWVLRFSMLMCLPRLCF